MAFEEKEFEDDETGVRVYVDPDTGIERRLGMLESTDDELNLLAAADVPDVPTSRWQVVTHDECAARVNAFMILFWLDQLSHSSCVGGSGAGALQYVLWSIGFPLDGKLSLAYIYAWINGNRDAGASIVAALRALQQHGTCFERTVGVNTIYRRQMPAGADEEAQRFKLETGSPLSGFESIGSALQCNKPVQFGIRAGRGFSNYDDEGVVAYLGRGSNHSVWAFPLMVRMRRGGFKIPMVNSWGSKWGPFGHGWAYVTEQHLNGGGGGFIHGTPNYDPQAPRPPRAA